MTEIVKDTPNKTGINLKYFSNLYPFRILKTFKSRIILLIILSTFPSSFISVLIEINYYKQNKYESSIESKKKSDEIFEKIHSSIIDVEKISDFFNQKTMDPSQIYNISDFLNEIENKKYCIIIINNLDYQNSCLDNIKLYLNQGDFLKIIQENTKIFILHKNKKIFLRLDIGDFLYKNNNISYQIASKINPIKISQNITPQIASRISNDIDNDIIYDEIEFNQKTISIKKKQNYIGLF
ncbi:hypothetical protein [Neokomagataea anthophila]|uniref:Uncharacterized protein n=1 Tax=Neokomagataea anthophila TaxID=2826925 RepID=A0ABS5E705_9PROT|nr:hypothetical protein [Neokomagataea anthophila]MBR0559641.1 hypothetical protein [Neokomagataea anthophila]